MKKFGFLFLIINVMTFVTSATDQEEDAYSKEWDMFDYNRNEILLLNLRSVYKDGYNIHGTIRLEKIANPLNQSNGPNVVTADVVVDCINSKLKIENVIGYDDDQMTKTNSQINKDDVRKRIADDYKGEIMVRLCDETK